MIAQYAVSLIEGDQGLVVLVAMGGQGSASQLGHGEGSRESTHHSGVFALLGGQVLPEVSV